MFEPEAAGEGDGPGKLNAIIIIIIIIKTVVENADINWLYIIIETVIL